MALLLLLMDDSIHNMHALDGAVNLLFNLSTQLSIGCMTEHLVQAPRYQTQLHQCLSHQAKVSYSSEPTLVYATLHRSPLLLLLS